MFDDNELILVVDDDLETLELLKLALKRAGFDVLIASNWREVSKHVQTVYQNNRPIDVIILDLMMPEKSGFDILRSLHVDLVPMPPVIMLTAVTGMQQRLDAQELGITKYITKPTKPQALINAINEVIKAKPKTIFARTRGNLPPKTFSG